MIGTGKYLKLVLTCALGSMVSPCMAGTADVDAARSPITVSSSVVQVHYSTNTLRGTKSGLLTKAEGGAREPLPEARYAGPGPRISRG